MLTEIDTDIPTAAEPDLAAAGASAAAAIIKTVQNSSTSRIPGEKDRPRFVVFDDWFEEGSAKLRPGVWHFGIKPGRGEAPPTLTQQWVCSPLHLDAVTTDAQGKNYGRLLRIKDLSVNCLKSSSSRTGRGAGYKDG